MVANNRQQYGPWILLVRYCRSGTAPDFLESPFLKFACSRPSQAGIPMPKESRTNSHETVRGCLISGGPLSLRPWMIVPPVRNWFGSVRFEVFTNRWFVIGTWFCYLLRSYLVRYVVRNMVRSYLVRYVVRKPGTMLFGSVRDR